MGINGSGIISISANLLGSSDMKVLPDFIPNDYLFETHKDKGAEKW
jgi:hypothetical protein